MKVRVRSRAASSERLFLRQARVAQRPQVRPRLRGARSQFGVAQRLVGDAKQRFGSFAAGRLGKLLQCDCYVKWYRSPAYYSRPIKGSWQTEGGGALMNQAIHQVDILRWLAGPVAEVFGMWQLGALH